MAFRFGDPGGRGYNTIGTSQANLLAWWNGPGAPSTGFIIVPGGGRSGGNSLRFADSAPCYVSKVLDSQPTWGITLAIKVVSPPSSFSQLLSLYDSVTSQCDLRVNSSNFLFVTRGGTTLGTASIPLITGTWMHVEWLTTINNATGTTQLWINGVSVLNLTAQNTRVSGNNSANTIYVGNSTGGLSVITWDMDDIIIYDQQLTDPQGNPDIVGPIGDCGLAWSLPNGDGASSQFSRDSGANNYLRVNEVTPDGDTSYTFDNTINHIDTYAMANLPAGATGVKSLMAVSYMRKDDVGARMVAPVIRTNSANFVGPTVSLPGSYLYYTNNWGQNPSGTPANWSVTDVNAIEGGLKVIS